MGELSINKQELLVNKLISLLQRLNFSNIWVLAHPDYPNPPPSKTIVENYTPSLVAEKNSIDYYFEFIDDHFFDKKTSNSAVQEMIETSNNKWDITIVMVIRYGETEKINKLCNHFNIYPSQIWEL